MAQGVASNRGLNGRRANASTEAISDSKPGNELQDAKRDEKKKTKYKTFILSDAIFEVECRYDIKEIVGHGAYGVVR